MSKQQFSSVWEAREGKPEEAENMKLRSGLMLALKAHLARTGMSQSQAARLFGVTQPRVSDLMRGKIKLFGLDALLNMAAAAGLDVEQRAAGRFPQSSVEQTRGMLAGIHADNRQPDTPIAHILAADDDAIKLQGVRRRKCVNAGR